MANMAIIEAALQELRAEPLPMPLEAWHIESGPDWSGDPAVWVWILLRETNAPDPDIDNLFELQNIVHERVKNLVDDDSFVYVRIGDVSDFKKAS